ncbi:nuclear body protein SP140-like protein isoform X1 [Erpetoichthys calabaricus]|uniref:nuclear body protein SP140-like protein isoform X1 n=2 Tax=Erpetoichthys calabaricus TaxID=27687 RepID=UPI00223411BD|nr:nuclear body protein SP140-like protein isoform X1 [Erpetoichthys calabaricus]
MCSELPFLFARLQHPVEMKELSEAPLTDGTLKTNMSQLEFLTDDELLQVFHKKKTEISIIDDPTMFLNQLRDNDVIPEEQYQKIKKMRKKNDAVYTLLDWLENEQPAKIRRFFESVFEDHIIQQYPKFKVLKYEVLEVQTTVQKDSATVGGKNGFTFDSGAKEDPQPVGVPPPTAQASTSKKRKADKPVYGSPRKNNQKEDPEPIWTYPLYQVELPVTCGNKTGSLHRKKLTKGEDCIFTEGKWYSPGEFEAYGGRSSSKNWKISIRCNNVPLIKLIEAGHLESPPFKKRKMAQHAKGKVPKAPTKNKTSASGMPASEPSTIKVKRKPTGSATQPPQDKDMPSSSSASESESSDIDTDDDDDDNDEEEDDEGECPIAKLKKFPVTCGSAEGVLHKHRFATGTCGKCIRTEQGWFTPTDFLKLDDTVSDKSWRRSIQFNGKAILYLIEKKILEPHSLICHCRICKSVDVNNLQDNDDECGICSQAGSLVCCDQCPRAFHPECHVPSAEKEAEEVSPREKWCCTFCKFNESRKTLPAFARPGFTQAVVFNFPVQDHLLKCQYLLIKLYSEDKKRIFGPNPNYTVKDYSEYIEKPMWLDKIKDKLTSGLYDTVEQFFKDIHLIFSNCAKFNKVTFHFFINDEDENEKFVSVTHAAHFYILPYLWHTPLSLVIDW